MSAERYRLLTGYESDPEGPIWQVDEALAFCKANGIDPDNIPAHGSFRIVGDEIHYREWADGKRGAGRTEWQSVPMVSPPEDHSLGTFEVVALGAIADRLEAALIAEAGYKSADDPAMGAAMQGLFERQAATLAVVVQQIIADEMSR